MAKRDCDRCAFGKIRRAVTDRSFPIDDTIYTLKLCDEHAQMFDREREGWARLASSVRPAGLFPEPSPLRPPVDLGVTEEIRAIQQAARQRARAVQEQQVVADEGRDAAELWMAQRHIQVLPDMWELSDHARERAEERHFTEVEVLEAVNRPETTYPCLHPDYKGAWMHRRGRCCVVVNRETGTIITILDDDLRPEYDLTAVS